MGLLWQRVQRWIQGGDPRVFRHPGVNVARARLQPGDQDLTDWLREHENDPSRSLLPLPSPHATELLVEFYFGTVDPRRYQIAYHPERDPPVILFPPLGPEIGFDHASFASRIVEARILGTGGVNEDITEQVLSLAGPRGDFYIPLVKPPRLDLLLLMPVCLHARRGDLIIGLRTLDGKLLPIPLPAEIQERFQGNLG